jgi:hypothetical protein
MGRAPGDEGNVRVPDFDTVLVVLRARELHPGPIEAAPGPERGSPGGIQAGIDMVNTAPPVGWLAAVTVPPWAVMICSTMARPRPEPGFERAVSAR